MKVVANSRDLKSVPTDGYAMSTTDVPPLPTTSEPPLKRRRTKSNESTWVEELRLGQEERDLVRTGWLNGTVVDAVNKHFPGEWVVAE